MVRPPGWVRSSSTTRSSWRTSASRRSKTSGGAGDPTRSSRHRSFRSAGQAGWIMRGGIVPDADSTHEYRLFLVPAGDVTVEDTWYSAGLRGSGSDNVRATGVFVPEHRTVAMDTLRDGHSPGGLLNHAPIYNQPFMAYAGHAMV